MTQLLVQRPPQAQPPTGQRTVRWWVLVAVSLATFMTALDNNVVNVALPSIQRELRLPVSGLEWVVSGYILVFAGLMLVGGRLADLFGARRVFLTGLVVFTVASLSAGTSVAAGPAAGGVLIGSRAVQGLGAALLAPTALALLRVAFPDTRERNLAVGIWSAVSALSLALGPLAGGLISQRWQWGWIFLINVPLGVITYVIGAAAIRHPTTAEGASRRRLDAAGLVTSAVALFGLTYALIEGQSRGWASPLIVGAFTVAAAAGGAFVVVESRAADPMIDLSLFRVRVFAGGTLATGLWAFGVFGIYFFTALYLQDALGFTPTRAGAMFVPMAVVMAVVATVSGPLATRLGTHRTVAAALAIMALAILGLASVDQHAQVAVLMPWFLTYGLGAGLLVPLSAAVLSQLPAERAGVASGVLNLSREVFGLLGVTVLGAILSAQQTVRLHAGPPLAAFVTGYRTALLVAAAIVAVGIPISLHALRARRPEPRPTPAATHRDTARRDHAAPRRCLQHSGVGDSTLKPPAVIVIDQELLYTTATPRGGTS
jgi:EmrB/QacA subfamily drug resistance transporter